MKSEPTTFSIDDLAAAPNQTTCWEGVRNYQARNLLRDEIATGDRVLFYHSACAVPACVGTAVVVREGYPDHHAWDPRHHYHDPKSSPEKPTWYMVDIRLESRFDKPVSLTEVRQDPLLADMPLLRKGNRLSIQPVTKRQFDRIVRLGKAQQ
ncbi:MAG: EVE domain-containing protein [Planctomycetaceae bacterium]|nr:MAG: EVE domain-containing protein [Planctomycetaceae bacterium]